MPRRILAGLNRESGRGSGSRLPAPGYASSAEDEVSRLATAPS